MNTESARRRRNIEKIKESRDRLAERLADAKDERTRAELLEAISDATKRIRDAEARMTKP